MEPDTLRASGRAHSVAGNRGYRWFSGRPSPPVPAGARTLFRDRAANAAATGRLYPPTGIHCPLPGLFALDAPAREEAPEAATGQALRPHPRVWPVRPSTPPTAPPPFPPPGSRSVPFPADLWARSPRGSRPRVAAPRPRRLPGSARARRGRGRYSPAPWGARAGSPSGTGPPTRGPWFRTARHASPRRVYRCSLPDNEQRSNSRP